jgi:haloacetate dehalogenase
LEPWFLLAQPSSFPERLVAPSASTSCASLWIDRPDDDADRRAGRRVESPLLLVTGAEETQLADAESVWRRWARDVRVVPGGHFVPEDAPREVASALSAFLSPGW